MMTGRNNHFHVRESNLQSNLKEAIDRAILRLARHVGISGVDEVLESVSVGPLRYSVSSPQESIVGSSTSN